VRLLFEPGDESACPLQCHVEIVNAEEQEGSTRIQDLTKWSWAGGVWGWPKSDWYHLKLPGTSLTPMIVHVRFIGLA
jgi:hypothetical protein